MAVHTPETEGQPRTRYVVPTHSLGSILNYVSKAELIVMCAALVVIALLYLVSPWFIYMEAPAGLGVIAYLLFKDGSNTSQF